jgi:shikimate kinase
MKNIDGFQNQGEVQNGNIILIGFMGTGKSVVGKLLSSMLSMELLEMDEMIAYRERMSIPEIFKTYGEEHFRDLETELLAEIQSCSKLVVSCGGGAVLRESNVEKMKKNGKVVLLTASPETILERVKNNEARPILKGNKNAAFIRELMETRQERYEAAADIIIHTDNKELLQICEELVEQL